MKTYTELRGHGPDFKVKYRLYSAAEGGREATYQHLRCDFAYEGDDITKGQLYAIHPEFMNEAGLLPVDVSSAVGLTGWATMWILNPKLRQNHIVRIKPGVKGYFMEGARKIADVEVTEVLGLSSNPQE